MSSLGMVGRGRFPLPYNGPGGIWIREFSALDAELPAASTMPTWRSYQTDLPALDKVATKNTIKDFVQPILLSYLRRIGRV